MASAIRSFPGGAVEAELAASGALPLVLEPLTCECTRFLPAVALLGCEGVLPAADADGALVGGGAGCGAPIISAGGRRRSGEPLTHPSGTFTVNKSLSRLTCRSWPTREPSGGTTW